ncbi:MAG: hypothetical protein LBD32_01630, partial [Cytophagales bacterium]|nr:hypothetical protein [Cytophagales bacterium]
MDNSDKTSQEDQSASFVASDSQASDPQQTGVPSEDQPASPAVSDSPGSGKKPRSSAGNNSPGSGKKPEVKFGKYSESNKRKVELREISRKGRFGYGNEKRFFFKVPASVAKGNVFTVRIVAKSGISKGIKLESESKGEGTQYNFKLSKKEAEVGAK